MATDYLKKTLDNIMSEVANRSPLATQHRFPLPQMPDDADALHIMASWPDASKVFGGDYNPYLKVVLDSNNKPIVTYTRTNRDLGASPVISKGFTAEVGDNKYDLAAVNKVDPDTADYFLNIAEELDRIDPNVYEFKRESTDKVALPTMFTGKDDYRAAFTLPEPNPPNSQARETKGGAYQGTVTEGPQYVHTLLNPEASAIYQQQSYNPANPPLLNPEQAKVKIDPANPTLLNPWGTYDEEKRRNAASYGAYL